MDYPSSISNWFHEMYNQKAHQSADKQVFITCYRELKYNKRIYHCNHQYGENNLTWFDYAMVNYEVEDETSLSSFPSKILCIFDDPLGDIVEPLFLIHSSSGKSREDKYW